MASTHSLRSWVDRQLKHNTGWTRGSAVSNRLPIGIVSAAGMWMKTSEGWLVA